MMKSLWKLLSPRSLRFRIALTITGMTVALGVAAVLYAEHDLANILGEGLRSRGIAIANGLASASARYSMTEDLFAVNEAINNAFINNEDVRYVFLVEPSGDTGVSMFAGGVPLQLVTANAVEPGKTATVRTLSTNEGPVIDVAVPVVGGQGGIIRVGMSEAGLRQAVSQLVVRLSLLVVAASVASVAASLLLASVLTRPLVSLSRVAKAVGSGDLGQKVPAGESDEAGDLARSFNAMTDDLVRSRDDLMRRNTELRIISSMADHLSQRLAPEEIPGTSLQKLLEMTGLSMGWMCIDAESGRQSVLCQGGVVSRAETQADPRAPCHGLRNGRCEMIQDGERCPMFGEVAVGGSIGMMAVAPLSSRRGILGVMVVASGQSPGPGEPDLGTLRSVGQQIGAALEGARLDREVRQKEQARRQLLDKFIVAQEDERKRIAREIHDEPAQALTAIVMRLDRLQRRLPGVSDSERKEMETAHGEARRAMESLHQIMVQLRPQALDDLGLLPAIRWYAELRLGERDIDVDFRVTGNVERLNSGVETTVFRLMQEAINNIYKHSGARHAVIRLDFDVSAVRGFVEDDGMGFDVAALHLGHSESIGLGLMGMDERANILGGVLLLTSEPGKGTRVSFEIPLSEREAA